MKGMDRSTDRPNNNLLEGRLEARSTSYFPLSDPGVNSAAATVIRGTFQTTSILDSNDNEKIQSIQPSPRSHRPGNQMATRHPSHRKRSTSHAILPLLCVMMLCGRTWGFLDQSMVRQQTRQHRNISLVAKVPPSLLRPSSLRAKRSPTGDFELQELKAQLASMKLQGVASKSLPPTKRFELEAYARAVAESKASSIPLDQLGTHLPSTKWRLVFSTENAALSELPRDAIVLLDFNDGEHVDYSLQFGEKTMGLNRITAKSSWATDLQGLVSITYERITCDAFGFSNIGIGAFGLLKGRVSYIQTVYLDDDIWIDGGTAPDGSQFLSVYANEANSNN